MTPQVRRQVRLCGVLIYLIRITLIQGEFTMMNVEERKQVIKTAVDAAKDSDVFILAGITCNSTNDTVELARYSGEVGAEYVLALPPHAVPITKEAMMDYFKAIKANTTSGLVLYHFPGETNITFSPEEIVEMGRSGLICAVKNTAGMEHTQELILANGHNPDLKITNGFDSLAFAAMACGADALINAGSNKETMRKRAESMKPFFLCCCSRNRMEIQNRGSANTCCPCRDLMSGPPGSRFPKFQRNRRKLPKSCWLWPKAFNTSYFLKKNRPFCLRDGSFPQSQSSIPSIS